ncbi:MAG TPA: M20/M25/M40 family metallo-hydrolase [Thermoanaerobaculia bacterium]|nr:M20/M25/M40 family metallo-hydrolase [Thermoanaerobaculia bacterium]
MTIRWREAVRGVRLRGAAGRGSSKRTPLPVAADAVGALLVAGVALVALPVLAGNAARGAAPAPGLPGAQTAVGGAALGGPTGAVDPAALQRAVREYRRRHEVAILRELAGFVALPNVAADLPGIRRNAAALIAMLRRRGIEARLLTAGGEAGGGAAAEGDGGLPPVVYGELRAPGARHTLVIYAHYDGQPVDAAEWRSPPWQPVLRSGPLPAAPRDLDLAAMVETPAGAGAIDPEWRLFGRSASDDKGPIVAMMAALDALRAAGRAPAVTVKFFFEGEEEAGSPHLGALLARHRALLAADAWLLADGPVHASRRPQVCFGARGVTPLEITAYGPVRALHSGHYGNWTPNPAALLVELLAALRGPDGAVLVPGFGDDVLPLSAAERQAVAAMPAVEGELASELGMAASERPGERLQDALMRPALNLDGLRAGQVGAQARNAIPTTAIASLDFRLVPDQTPAKVRARVEEHLRRAGYTLLAGAAGAPGTGGDSPAAAARRAHPRLVRLVWGAGYPGARTAMDLPVSRAVLATADEAAGAAVVRVPMLGGSIPMYLFHEATGAPVILLPTVNHDNSQHAADENLRLQNLWDGIDLFAALYSRLESHWSP